MISLLLHTVVLHRGEALYLPAGNIHAYQEGLGIELMGPSDNVLRGGLTPKHVDVAELLAVLDFRALPAPVLVPKVADGVADFAPDGAGFRMRVLKAGVSLEVSAPAIALPVERALRVSETVVALPDAVTIVDGTETITAVGRTVIASAA